MNTITRQNEPSSSDLEELRMLRTLLQHATEKNKYVLDDCVFSRRVMFSYFRNLKITKEKILLRRKILAIERENNSLKDEIGGLEKQTISAHASSQIQRAAHSGQCDMMKSEE